MPHVSKHTPTQKVSTKTLNLFMECVTAKWSSEERRAFFGDLLTSTERVMLSKRLAVIYMLVKGHTFFDIEETLKVSNSTVSRVWRAMEMGKYAEIVRHINKPRKGFDLVAWFSDLMPPKHQTRREYAERMRRLKL